MLRIHVKSLLLVIPLGIVPLVMVVKLLDGVNSFPTMLAFLSIIMPNLVEVLELSGEKVDGIL